MNRRSLTLSLVLIATAIPVGHARAASPATAPTTYSDSLPALSAQGRQKAAAVVQSIEGQRQQLKAALVRIDHNLQKIDGKNGEPEKVESSIRVEKRKWLDYIERAHREMAKNEKSIADLNDALRKARPLVAGDHAAAPPNDSGPSLDSIQRDLLDRERWKLDAQSKVVRVQKQIDLLSAEEAKLDQYLKTLAETRATWLTQREKHLKRLDEFDQMTRSLSKGR